MQTSIKLLLPSLVYLFLGMLIFAFSDMLPFPPLSRFFIGVFFSVIIFFGSMPFLRYENISLTVVHLIPNKKTIIRLITGLVIGAVILGIMLFLLFSLTDLSIEPNQNQTWIPFLLASSAFIPLALMEELLFRGYPFFRLSQIINIRWVLLITATLFALYHYNGSQNIGALLLGPGVWGVTFGVAAYLSKSIAVPLGIHISANFIQAIFGLKLDYNSIWTVTKTIEETKNVLDAEILGVTMQLFLLIVTVIVFEVRLGYKHRNMKKN